MPQTLEKLRAASPQFSSDDFPCFYPSALGEILNRLLKYLCNQFDAIHIRFTDPETRKGGATEPHISHILSVRLSSRPMAWSEETLRHFVPVLASGRFLLKKKEDNSSKTSPKTAKRKKKRKTVPFSLGLPDPDRAVSLPARSGKVTPLFNALRPF